MLENVDEFDSVNLSLWDRARHLGYKRSLIERSEIVAQKSEDTGAQAAVMVVICLVGTFRTCDSVIPPHVLR